MWVGHEGWTEDRRALPVLRQFESLGVVVNLPQELGAVQLLERVNTGLDVNEPPHLVIDDITLHEQRALIGDEFVDDHAEVRVGFVGHVGADDVTYVLCKKAGIGIYMLWIDTMDMRILHCNSCHLCSICRDCTATDVEMLHCSPVFPMPMSIFRWNAVRFMCHSFA